MQVLILAVADFPDGFATAERIKLLALALKQEDCSVFVGLIHATRNNVGGSINASCGEHQGIPYEYLNGSSSRPQGVIATLKDTISGMYNSCKKFVSLCSNDDDTGLLLYTPNLIKCLPALLTAKIMGKKVVFEFCEVRSSSGSENKANWKRKLSSIGDKLSESIAPVAADGLIAISNPIMQYYSDKGIKPNKLLLVPALSDVAAAVQAGEIVGVLSGKSYFLSSGSYSTKEGVDTIMDAFALIAEENKDIHLAFTGQPPAQVRNKFEAIATQYNFIDRLHFLGYLSRDELMWSYQNAAALLACRSYSDFSNYGFPTKFVEYLSSGSPVIVTDVGDPHTYIEEGVSGYIAKADNPENLAEKMKIVIGSANTSMTLGHKGLKIAEKNFDYRQYGQSILGLFSE